MTLVKITRVKTISVYISHNWRIQVSFVLTILQLCDIYIFFIFCVAMCPLYKSMKKPTKRNFFVAACNAAAVLLVSLGIRCTKTHENIHNIYFAQLRNRLETYISYGRLWCKLECTSPIYIEFSLVSM